MWKKQEYIIENIGKRSLKDSRRSKDGRTLKN